MIADGKRSLDINDAMPWFSITFTVLTTLTRHGKYFFRESWSSRRNVGRSVLPLGLIHSLIDHVDWLWVYSITYTSNSQAAKGVKTLWRVKVTVPTKTLYSMMNWLSGGASMFCHNWSLQFFGSGSLTIAWIVHTTWGAELVQSGKSLCQAIHQITWSSDSQSLKLKLPP